MVSLRSHLQRLWPSDYSPNRGTTEASRSDPIPPTDATLDIRGNAILRYLPSPKHISGSSPKSELGAPLLNLPSEVRCQIWEKALGGRTIHLEIEGGSLQGV